jgi:hypothetical protein
LGDDLVEQVPAPMGARRALEHGLAVVARGAPFRMPTVGCQPHLELVEFMNVLTEVTKAEVCTATVAISPAEGLEDTPLTVLLNASKDDLIDAVSLGKSLCADLTNAVEFVLILFSCASSPLTPLLTVRSVRPLTELSKFERSEQ